MLAVSLAVGLAAAVLAVCLAGSFAHSGWHFYSRLKWTVMCISATIVLVASLVFVWLLNGTLRDAGTDSGVAVWVVVVVAVGFNAIVWHDLWCAWRKLKTTRRPAQVAVGTRQLV